MDDVGAAENRLREHVNQFCDAVRSDKGAFTGTDLLALLTDLGMTADEVDIRPHLSDWQNVTNDAAFDVMSMTRAAQNIDAARLVQRIDESTIKLSFFSYLWYLMPCSTKNPEWENRKVELSVDLTPRQILFLTTAIVLLIAGMAILVVMSVMWLDQANTRARVQIEAQHLLISSFAVSFEEQFIAMEIGSLTDQADTFAKLLEHRYLVTSEGLAAQLNSDASLLSSLLTTTAEGVTNSTSEAMMVALGAIADIAAANATLSDIANAVSVLNNATQSSAYLTGDSAGAPWESILVRRTNQATNALSVIVEFSVLECTYGPCDYTTLPCVTGAFQRMATDGSVLRNDNTVSIQRTPAVSLSVYLPQWDAVVCSILLRDDLVVEQVEAASTVLRQLSTLEASGAADGYVYFLASLPRTDDTPTFLVEAPLQKASAECAANAESCNAAHVAVRNALVTGMVYSVTGKTLSGVETAIAAVRVPGLNLAVAIGRQLDALRSAEISNAVSLAEKLNNRTDFDVEISIAQRLTPYLVAPQLNAFRYAANCLTACNRFDAASVAATLAVDTKVPGFVIAPNYEPRSVIASYGFAGNGLDLGIVAEVKVETLRTKALESLAQIVDANNQALPGTTEVLLVTFEGMPANRVFDPDERCDYVRECLRDADHGAMYRSDCSHCSMLPRGIVRQRRLRYLTKLKLLSDCNAVRNCSASSLALDQGGIIRDVLNSRVETAVHATTTDYRGASVVAVASYLGNWSVALVVKADLQDVTGPVQARIGIAAAISFVVVVLGLAILIVFSRRVLDQIEQEWLKYKEQIDTEKRNFDEIVKDAVPPAVREELAKTGRQAMSFPSLSFAFLDVVGMSERTKAWSPDVVCRFVTYIFTLVDIVGGHYRVQKVRMFGDTYFAVAGIGDTPGGGEKEHCATRCASFGAIVTQLLSVRFAHYPDSVPHIHEAFRDVVAKHGPAFPDVVGNAEDVGHVTMPKMRVGMHFGSGTVAVIETGRTPLFEIFGPGVGLAARMQVTAQGNRVHVSGTMKEILERLNRDVFEFDAPRKTVVKGQGTVTSYFLRSANVPVPEEILSTLGIRYSNLKVVYEEAGTMGPSMTAGGGGGH